MQEERCKTGEERRAEAERQEQETNEAEKEYRKPVGESIQRVRESRSMSREQLAEAVGTGITAEDIASYESGEGVMPILEFVRIAEVFGVEPDDLIPKSMLDLPEAAPTGYDSLSIQDRRTVDRVITAFLDQRKYRQST